MKTFTEIEDWLIENIGFEVFEPGLERITKIIEELKLWPKARIITIGGTNGKGSVTRLLSSTLAQKYKVAQFTSPHLLNLSERFILNGEQIKDDELWKIVQKVWQQTNELKVKLTYYEFIFVVFLNWTQGFNVDYMVLEVGLGGRLDAVNALDAQIAVITSIGRDHQEYLGNTYSSILNEKLGICRDGKALVTGFELKYLTQRASRFCLNNNITYFNIMSSSSFQNLNEKIVSKVLELLQEDLRIIKDNFKNQNTYFDFFGAHNPAAVRKLVQFLLQQHYNNKGKKYEFLLLAFSHRKEKDLAHMLKLFKMLEPKIVEKILVTSFQHFKAEKENVIMKIANKNGFEFVKEIDANILSNKKNLVSGSNYFYRTIFNLYKNTSKI